MAVGGHDPALFWNNFWKSRRTSVGDAGGIGCAVDVEQQCGKVGEASQFARTRPGQPVRTGFHECEVGQVAELGCKPSGQNVPVTKQASDRAVAIDRRPMPLI